MIIDCDCHFFPRDAFDHIDASLAERAPRPVFEEGILVDIEFPGAPTEVLGATPNPPPGSGAKYTGMADLDVRMADYDKLGIDVQLMLPQFTGWWSYLIDPELASAMAHSWNVAVRGVMDRQPGRIHGVALVALQDVDAAIAELRWARTNGFKAVVLDYNFPVWEHPYGTALATHREVWPFFAVCEELDMPVFLHAVQHGHRLVNMPSFQADGLDHFAPSEPQMNLAALITSGLLDEYPGLKIVHAELGAARIRSMAEAMDARYRRLQPDYEDADGFNAISRRRLAGNTRQLVPPDVIAEKNKHEPSYYFRTNFYWTVETEQSDLADAVAFAGADRFLFATDYPHDDPGGSKKFEDVALLEAHQGLTEDEKEQVRWRNAASVFGLS